MIINKGNLTLCNANNLFKGREVRGLSYTIKRVLSYYKKENMDFSKPITYFQKKSINMKKVGRPKIATKQFPYNWVTEVLNMMGQGASQKEVQAYLDIATNTFMRIMRDEKVFLNTIKKGRRLSQAWWEKEGRTNLHSKDFNPTLWYMNMKNRFGWRDRNDITSREEKIGESPFTEEKTSEIAKDLHRLIYGDKNPAEDGTEATGAQDDKG